LIPVRGLGLGLGLEVVYVCEIDAGIAHMAYHKWWDGLAGGLVGGWLRGLVAWWVIVTVDYYYT